MTILSLGFRLLFQFSPQRGRKEICPERSEPPKAGTSGLRREVLGTTVAVASRLPSASGYAFGSESGSSGAEPQL